MNLLPQQGSWHPANEIAEVADFLGDPVQAADFPQTILRFRNDRWATDVGVAGLSDTEWVAHFGRFRPFEGSLPQPLALRYHGHQFRNYNPDIGDGRGFLFAQMRDSRGRLLDFGTKGSGQTPYSRFGDGRLTLKGAVREILATEMLEALGVETSKTFSVIETGEALHRGDEPSPTRSAVLVRLNHSHLRIGSFQRLATLRDTDSLARLVDYALTRYFGEEPGEDGALRLLGHVVRGTAQMAARFMSAGFVHGVLNSDNINITGESFDYGPWRFAPRFEGGFTAAYFDESGLYAFGRQAEAIHWDVIQLAMALYSFAEEDALVEAINGFAPAYFAELNRAMCWRLGVAQQDEESDRALVMALEQGLSASGAGLDRFFFDWRGGELRKPSPDDAVYDHPSFAEFRTQIGRYRPSGLLDHSYWSGESPCSMLIAEVESLWESIASHEDWSPLWAKVAAIREMGAAMSR